MTMEQISDLDLSYTPPLSSPWDPVQMAAQACSKQANMVSKKIDICIGAIRSLQESTI